MLATRVLPAQLMAGIARRMAIICRTVGSTGCPVDQLPESRGEPGIPNFRDGAQRCRRPTLSSVNVPAGQA